jgi:predicted DNA-binding transcriptional regulator AlpA
MVTDPLEHGSFPPIKLEHHERQELEALLFRFDGLTTRAQLRAYEFISTFLSARIKETDAAHQIAERKEALAAIARVAKELKLDGKAPTTTQFREVSKRLQLGWSVSRVGRAWGRWRFACEAFTGHRLRKTAFQNTLLDVNTGKRAVYENPLTAIYLWLESKPVLEQITVYDAWARELNADLPLGQLPVTMWSTIASNLRVSFADAIRVARGEEELANCRRKRRNQVRDYGPLVSRGWIASTYGLSEYQAANVPFRPDFPSPVVTLSNTNAWLKEDVEAYFTEQPFPRRKKYSMQDEFLSLAELAPMMGKRYAKQISQTTLIPEPAGMVGKTRYWRRSEVKRWLREKSNKPSRR